ncbi:MAG: DUF1508 domain-containing protein [Clostridia bacterium]|nr:DUF1508 domain-containing protein [Clostridia bacterium]
MEAIKKLFAPLASALNMDALVVAIIAAVLALAVIAIIVIVIVKCVKKSKKKKSSEPYHYVDWNVEPEVKEDIAPADTVEKEESVAIETAPVLEQEQPAESETVTKKSQPVKAEKKPTAKKTVVKKEKESVKEPKKLNGKWSVEFKGEGEYISKLAASNGEVMLSSEIYTTEEGARNGIATIIKGVDSGKFIVYQDKSKNYYYKLKTAGNRLLCVGEIYKSKERCLKAVETVKRIAKNSPILEELNNSDTYAVYTPQPLDVSDVKKGLRGKWKIETTESGNYTAKLYASNGQLMLATEEVALEKSAKNAITAVKKNAAEGNFIIDHDKFGRFYYKLRNVQKSVICIGEAYDTLDSCTSAIESVRRFAATAVIEGKVEQDK